MPKLPALAVVLLASFPARATCPNVEAIELANRADAAMGSNIDEAIDKLARATTLDPNNARIFFKLARAYAKKDDWARAADAAKSASSLAPTYATYRAFWGYLLTRQGKWAEAKVALEGAVQNDPNNADALLDLATTLEHLHDEQGALADYTRAVRARPSMGVAFVALGDLYRRLGYPDQALAVAAEGLRFDPTPHVHFLLASLAGSLAEERNAIPEAIARYREAKSACGACSEHGEASAFLNLGMALAAAKSPQKAEALSNLTTFYKLVCKGAAASRFASECTEAQAVEQKLGGP